LPKPELFISRLIFKMGYRYKLYGKYLPGKPDLVFAGRKKVIFIHGCFWHQHRNCIDSHIPKTNRDYCWLNWTKQGVTRKSVEIKKLGWSFLLFRM
jgi:DNA mismatch endonuclease (patch repair protein)